MLDTEVEPSVSNLESVVEAPPELDKVDKQFEPNQQPVVNVDSEQEETKASPQARKPDSTTKESPPPKSSRKKSSRFFSASYFSSGDEAEFSPSMAFSNLAIALKEQLVKVTVGIALLIAGYSFILNLLCWLCYVIHNNRTSISSSFH